MHFKIDSIIEYIAQYMTLNRGDLILTGTPSGAGPMKVGDKVECFARHGKSLVAEMSFTITK